MLGDEGHRRDQHPLSLPACLGDGFRGGRSDPLHRPHAALVAHAPVPASAKLSHDGLAGALHLVLIGVAALDDALRQAVGGEQQAQALGATRRFEGLADVLGMGPGQARRVEEAADLVHGPATLVGLAPGLDRGARGGGRILRIERQQDDLVRRKVLHRLRRRLGERVPIAHGHEAAGLEARQGRRQPRLKRLHLGRRLAQERRGAAHHSVVGAGLLAPAGGDEPGQQRAQRPGQADDGRIVEQVEQEGLHRVQAVRSAEGEQHHRQATPHAERAGGDDLFRHGPPPAGSPAPHAPPAYPAAPHGRG